ncbi:hypothetical protein NCG97_14835 [Streptomyces lydicamycinicus]|uniref:hypothetical protein n=1 Tax=Streptomyces lydicamycinicus TaxID=1546107 RepID=UPI0020353CEA|nr:hypothetical protein [Streptomyces lydicamycinicus]USA01671.1 hypothetical protein NCG97_14835 [Streptomyces lydicamycinicus]
MDDSFRDAVIDELYVHEERFAAPSLGIDAARVLAHALRARRLQLGWAAGILLLWIVALPCPPDSRGSMSSPSSSWRWPASSAGPRSCRGRPASSPSSCAGTGG